MSAPAPSELPSHRGYRYPAEIINHAVSPIAAMSVAVQTGLLTGKLSMIRA